jgi:hypothetical protein
MAINANFTDFADYKRETIIVACSTLEPFECKVFNISEQDLDKGTLEIVELMKDISWHVHTDFWEHTREYYEGDGSENL